MPLRDDVLDCGKQSHEDHTTRLFAPFTFVLRWINDEQDARSDRRDLIPHRILPSTSRCDRDKSRDKRIQCKRNSLETRAAQLSAGSQRASVWLADTLSVRVRLYKREGGRVETRDAGRRRGPRRHPQPLPRAAFSQNPPVTLSFLPSPPRPLARTLAPSSPLSRPGPRGAIRRFTPAMSTDAVRRSYSSSSLFLRFFPPPPSFNPPNSFALPCSIAFFYRVLYSSCHSRVRRESFAFLHRVSSALHRWSGTKPATIFTPDRIYSRGWMRLCRPTDDRVNASSGISSEMFVKGWFILPLADDANRYKLIEKKKDYNYEDRNQNWYRIRECYI